MLHGLAGFIFGKPPVESASSPAGRDHDRQDDRIKNAPNSAEIPFKKDTADIVTDEDEEWLLVDVHGDEKAADLPCDLDVALSSSGENSPTVEERGWRVTPPPCFTASYERERRLASGFVPIYSADKMMNEETIKEKASIRVDQHQDEERALNGVLETSNFENLLIEHPSMSVYGRIMPVCQQDGGTAVVAITQGFNTKQTVATVVLPKKENVVDAPAELVINQRSAAAESLISHRSIATESISHRSIAAESMISHHPVVTESVITHRSTTAEPVMNRRPINIHDLLLGTELSTAASRWTDMKKQQGYERSYKAKEMSGNRARRLNAAAIIPAHGSGSPRKRRMRNHQAGRCNDRKCQ